MQLKLIDNSYYEFYAGPVKGPVRKEQGEQIDAFSYASFHHPELLIFHPVNEGMIPAQYRQKLIESGMVKGVSDLVLLEPRGEYHGALFEMKRLTKSKSSVDKDQKEILGKARSRGYFTCVCFGREQFIKALLYYLAL